MVKLRLDTANGLTVTKIEPPQGFSFTNGPGHVPPVSMPVPQAPPPVPRGSAPVPPVSNPNPDPAIPGIQSRLTVIEQQLNRLLTPQPQIAPPPRQPNIILPAIAATLAFIAIISTFILFSATNRLKSNLTTI